MVDTAATIAAVCLLAVVTYAFRAALPLSGTRLADRLVRQLQRATTVLLLAVAAGSAVFEGGPGWSASRVAGVAIAVLCVWWRCSILVVIVIAASATALLRAAGVS